MKWKFKRQLGMTGGALFTFGVPDRMKYHWPLLTT